MHRTMQAADNLPFCRVRGETAVEKAGFESVCTESTVTVKAVNAVRQAQNGSAMVAKKVVRNEEGEGHRTGGTRVGIVFPRTKGAQKGACSLVVVER